MEVNHNMYGLDPHTFIVHISEKNVLDLLSAANTDEKRFESLYAKFNQRLVIVAIGWISSMIVFSNKIV